LPGLFAVNQFGAEKVLSPHTLPTLEVHHHPEHEQADAGGHGESGEDEPGAHDSDPHTITSNRPTAQTPISR
jgi:hypothetical protein